jgi:hypothetical protein
VILRLSGTVDDNYEKFDQTVTGADAVSSNVDTVHKTSETNPMHNRQVADAENMFAPEGQFIITSVGPIQ